MKVKIVVERETVLERKTYITFFLFLVLYIYSTRERYIVPGKER